MDNTYTEYNKSNTAIRCKQKIQFVLTKKCCQNVLILNTINLLLINITALCDLVKRQIKPEE